ncbi:putative CheA signal transduction histidine kina [Pseudomonas putida DOT-T1E]|jgi:chemotaxis protein histidine kinase CheA|uniref:CheA signal transduction histidine kina n=5 Tax=Pseudomonas TaxID=286 RepID=I7AV28_PSEPT|nr:putative CheA signal transduction histidine kina [Pseudomonas putida DOT-T1E]
MMDTALSFDDALQGFLLDAQVLLTQAQECLQHLELIDNDPDACSCLNNTLDTIARQATRLGLREVAHYTTALQQLLAPACHGGCLQREALPAIGACLTLLAWQLELVDSRTGRLNLDIGEQLVLLGELAKVVQAPFAPACASCDEEGSACIHPHSDVATGNRPSRSNRMH